MFRFLHIHWWRDTRTNPYWIVTEQRCRCGAARHLWDPSDAPMGGRTRWRQGRHPLSKDFR